MTKLITITFSKDNYGGNCVRSLDRDYPASSNSAWAAPKKKLVSSLKRRMQSFYPGLIFIFNIAQEGN